MPDRAAHPSRTAQLVALFRALESRQAPGRRLFEDPYAHAFLGARLRAVLAAAQVPLTGGLVTTVIDRGWPGARVGVLVRTRFIDEALATALQDGVAQVVILGSGFDTRAYRLPGVGRAHVFEVDAPVTVAFKRARMEALLGELPANVTTIALDFEHEDLGVALAQAAFDAQAPSLFVWEGVTSYLSAEAVDATLRQFAALGAPGSRIVLTYLDRAALEGRSDVAGAAAATAAVRRVGEPFRFGFDPSTLASYLHDRGLTLLEDVTAADLAARYLHPLGRRPVATPFFHVALIARM